MCVLMYVGLFRGSRNGLKNAPKSYHAFGNYEKRVLKKQPYKIRKKIKVKLE